VDGTQRERILSAARALGPSRFNQLVQSVDEVRRRQRLRHWQEELIAQLQGIEQPPIVTANEFVSIFGGAETLEVPPRVISREEFFAQPNYCTIWAMPSFQTSGSQRRGNPSLSFETTFRTSSSVKLAKTVS
jgi:hypothetical protein